MEDARVALVTSAPAVGLDDDEPLLRTALEARGAHVDVAVWDDGTVDWTAWDLAVVRSTWDYPPRRGRFLAWARAVDRACTLRNRPDVIAWNSDKRYLTALAAAGVPVVPTRVFGPDERVVLPDEEVVVKPAVSAGSQDTARYPRNDHDRALAHARALHAAGRDVLVQPYLKAVDEHGETALIYVADCYSHAIRKGPILRGTPSTVGGLFAEEDIAPRVPSAQERAVAEQALDALPFDRRDLLYARVDVLPADDGSVVVLEVELIEPSLFLRYDGAVADRLAEAILQQARPATRDRR